jgi:hypothetical protein
MGNRIDHFLHLKEVEDGLWLVRASVRVGEDHARACGNGEDNGA